MARIEVNSPTLTLELDPKKIPYKDFHQVVGAFTELLDEVAETACGSSDAVQWEITVSEGSVRLAANTPAAMDQESRKRVLEAVREPPRRVQEKLVNFPRVLPMRLLAGDEQGDVLDKAYLVPEDEPHPSQLAEYGTVEGTPDTLSARGRLYFTISEPIWDRAVRCTVPEELVDSMHGMWRKRVAAHGQVHYDRDGLPKSIQAEEIELFPYDDIPIGEFRGLLASD